MYIPFGQQSRKEKNLPVAQTVPPAPRPLPRAEPDVLN